MTKVFIHIKDGFGNKKYILNYDMNLIKEMLKART